MIRRKYLVWLVLCVYFVQACSAAPDAIGEDGPEQRVEAISEDVPSNSLHGYSSEELARGIIFGDGPVAESIPVIRNNLLMSNRVKDPKTLADARAGLNILIEDVKAQNPKAMQEFRQDVLSGDHLRIQEGIKKLAVSVNDAYQKRQENTQTNAVPNDRGLALVVTAVFVAAAVAFVWGVAAVDTAAAISGGVVIAYQLWVSDGENRKGDCLNTGCSSSSQALLSDRIINSIATTKVPVWRWTSASSFEKHEMFTGLGGDWQMQLGYFNSGTGLKADRLYYDQSGTTAHILFDSGSTKVTLTRPARSIPLIGNFDGRTPDDIVWRGPDGKATTWYFNGSPSGSIKRVVVKTKNSGYPYKPVVGDFNDDNVDDVLWYGWENYYDSVWFGTFDGDFRSGEAAAIGGSYYPVAGDFLMSPSATDVIFYAPGAKVHPTWEMHYIPPASNTISKTNWTVETPSTAYRPVAAFLNGQHPGNEPPQIYWFGYGTAAEDDRVWDFSPGARSWVTYLGGGMAGSAYYPRGALLVGQPPEPGNGATMFFWPYAPNDWPL